MKRTPCLMMTLSLLLLGVCGTTSAQSKGPSKGMRDATSQSQKAARVFREIMGAPDKAIPKDILARAECIAVFPQVIKAGFIIGGRGGRGLASCRTRQGWSGPAFLNMGGGSFGLQIG
ncbi:MAG: lipid-binding SYLF domain-containing protein, partial [Acidobacteriota bacterium]